MKNLKLFLAALPLLSALLFSACSGSKTESQANVQYFRHLFFSETQYDQYRGTFPLTAEEAKTINHYRFTNDESGRLVEVAFMRGETLLSYSELGAARVVITYTDSTEVHHFFDAQNQPYLEDKVFAYVYKLDANGKRTGLEYLDKEGKKTVNRNNIAWYTWKILPDGMVKENRYNTDGVEVIMNPFCPFFELRFSYDSNGYCTRLANYMADTLYNCTAENCGDIGVSYFDFIYGKGGRIKSFSVHNASGRSSNLYWGWSRFENELDENGYITRTTYFDQDGEYLGGKANPVNAYVFDEHGALIERKYMDKDGNLFVNPDGGPSVIKYTYLDNGMPKDTLKFDAKLAEIPKK